MSEAAAPVPFWKILNHAAPETRPEIETIAAIEKLIDEAIAVSDRSWSVAFNKSSTERAALVESFRGLKVIAFHDYGILSVSRDFTWIADKPSWQSFTPAECTQVFKDGLNLLSHRNQQCELMFGLRLSLDAANRDTLPALLGIIHVRLKSLVYLQEQAEKMMKVMYVVDHPHQRTWERGSVPQELKKLAYQHDVMQPIAELNELHRSMQGLRKSLE
jgi:hypothetical protein